MCQSAPKRPNIGEIKAFYRLGYRFEGVMPNDTTSAILPSASLPALRAQNGGPEKT